MYFASNVDAVLVVSHMYMYILNIDMYPKRKEGWTKMDKNVFRYKYEDP